MRHGVVYRPTRALCFILYCWLKLIHTATPDKARPARLPVDRRRDTGQAGSYA